jgi:hypothetical protein
MCRILLSKIAKYSKEEITMVELMQHIEEEFVERYCDQRDEYPLAFL